MWNKLWVSGVMCVGIVAVAGAQNAGSVAIDRCQNAATTTVRRARPNTDSVKYSTNPQIEQMSQYETEVRDVGEYQDRQARSWRIFAYNCQYNTQSSNANVSVTWTAEEVEPKRDESGPGARQPRRGVMDTKAKKSGDAP